MVTGEFLYLLVRSFVWALCMALHVPARKQAPVSSHTLLGTRMEVIVSTDFKDFASHVAVCPAVPDEPGSLIS